MLLKRLNYVLSNIVYNVTPFFILYRLYYVINLSKSRATRHKILIPPNVSSELLKANRQLVYFYKWLSDILTKRLIRKLF